MLPERKAGKYAWPRRYCFCFRIWLVDKMVPQWTQTISQSKLIVRTCSWSETWNKVSERLAIGFHFTSNWIKKWRVAFNPTTWLLIKWMNAKPVLFHIQFKIAWKRSNANTKQFGPIFYNIYKVGTYEGIGYVDVSDEARTSPFCV